MELLERFPSTASTVFALIFPFPLDQKERPQHEEFQINDDESETRELGSLHLRPFIGSWFGNRTLLGHLREQTSRNQGPHGPKRFKQHGDQTFILLQIWDNSPSMVLDHVLSCGNSANLERQLQLLAAHLNNHFRRGKST
eukprot:5528559-Amphidinium_carterae.1